MTALEIWYEGINKVWYMSLKRYEITIPSGQKVVVVDGVKRADSVSIINGDEYNFVKVKIPNGVFNTDDTKIILAPYGHEGDRSSLTVACDAPLEPVSFKFVAKGSVYPGDELDDDNETNGQIIILDPPDDPDDF